MGLELTKVQHVYWRAVQRRMLLGQLEDLINGNIETITAEQINLPYEIAVALVQHDPGKCVVYAVYVPLYCDTVTTNKA